MSAFECFVVGIGFELAAIAVVGIRGKTSAAGIRLVIGWGFFVAGIVKTVWP